MSKKVFTVLSRNILIVIALASTQLIIGSCEKEAGKSASNLVTLHATIENGNPVAKTSIAEDGKVYWLPGDDLYVYPGGEFDSSYTISPHNFTTDLTSPALSADFTGDIEIDEEETFFAFYPGASAVYSYWGVDDTGEMGVPLGGYLTPDNQWDVYDGDLNGNSMLVAMSQGGLDNVRFMNVLSGLKFSLSSSGFTEVSVEGNDGEAVAGAFTLDFDPFDNTPVITPADGAETVVKLTSNYKDFLTGEWLYLLLFPQSFENGITITFKKDGIVAGTVVINDPVEFKRGIWKKAANIDKRIVYSDFDENGNINFMDSEVKRLCVSNWDTDGDLEISLEEAAAVEDLGTVFKGSKIGYFNELKYFTGLTEIAENAFNGSTLKEMRLPSSITEIGRRAFNDCTQLSGELDLPDGLVSIGNYAFGSCSSLTGGLKIPNSVTTLGSQAFFKCSGLNGRLVLSENITEIKAQTFYACGFTGPLVIPDSVTQIGSDAFFKCEHFSGTLTIGSGVEHIGTYAFVCGDVYTYYCPFDTIIARGTTPAGLVRVYGDAISNVPPFSETISGTTSSGSKYNYKAPSTVKVPIGCSAIYSEKWDWTSKATIVEIEM